MKLHSRLLYILVFVWMGVGLAVAQPKDTMPSGAGGYLPIDENYIMETKWRYTYTTHTQTNTIIHRADNSYDYYVYFKYDHTYQNFLNGKTTMGTWLLNNQKNEIYYNFRNIKWWKLAELTNQSLILEFTVAKSSYQYHFIAVEPEDAPFVRAPNELPPVIIEAMGNRKGKKPKTNKPKTEVVTEPVAPPTYVEIALIGGGYYGGIDPIIKDFTHIKTDGRLVREFESEKKGLVKTKKDLTREELEGLAKFIEDKGFFALKNIYDCSTTDCNKRKTSKPIPIPLRLSVKYGTKSKIVTIMIYGQDDKRMRYVDYPKELDDIIASIQKLANG